MRICKNDITDLIRDQFGANPLRIPENRIRPMTLVEIKDRKLNYLGNFKYLVKGGLPQTPAPLESIAAAVNGKQSKKVKLKLGFDILGNFLKAFNIDSSVVSAAIENTKKIAFTFHDVKRHYFDILEFGQILSDHQISGNQENIFIQHILKNEDTQLGLITDALVSNNFSLSTFKDNETGIGIKIPLIQEYISDVDLNVEVLKTAENTVTFKGPTPLTFAFSCVELLIDPETGRFTRGEWFDNIQPRDGQEITKELNQANAKMTIDPDQANPLLLEF